MRTNILFLVLIAVWLLLQTSCSFEKRLHRPGFFVESGSYKQKNATKDLATNTKTNKPIEAEPLLLKEAISAVFHNEVVKEAGNIEKLLMAKANEKKSILFKNTEVSLAFKSDALQALKENNKAWTLLVAKKPSRGGNNQIVALLLCFFLGMLGIHSFYLGNTTKGIIQLVMFLVGFITIFIFIGYLIIAALGIWVLVDFIRIIIGDLGPGW